MERVTVVVVLLFLALAGGCLIMAWVGSAIGTPRGHRDIGMALSLLFGPVGWLVTAILPLTLEAQAKRQIELERKLEQIKHPPPPKPERIKRKPRLKADQPGYRVKVQRHRNEP